MRTVAERTDTLNSLRRGELAAVETYHQALARLGNEPMGIDLRAMEVDHRNAAEALSTYIGERGGRPAASSGVWGMWAKAVAGTAKLFGAPAALKVLKDGEEQGIEDYQNALEDQYLDDECRTLIHALLPQTRAHVALLDRLIDEAR